MLLNSVALGEYESSIIVYPELSRKPQNLYFLREILQFLDINNYSVVIVVVVNTVNAKENKIQVISYQFKFQNSFMQEIFIELLLLYSRLYSNHQG